MDQLREVVDIPSVEAQLKVLKDGLLEAKALIISMPVIGRVTGSAGDQAALTEKLRIANEQLAISQQKLVNNEEKLKVAAAQRAAQMEKSAAIITVAEEKVKKAILETEMAEERLKRARAQGSSALEAQRKREEKTLADLNNQYKQLSITHKELEQIAHNASLKLGPLHNNTLIAQREARDLGAQLKDLEYKVGRFNRNVGNYPGGGPGGPPGPGGGDEGGGDGSFFDKNSSGVQGLLKGWRAARYAAYILPGIGVAGLIGGLVEGLGKVGEALASMGDHLYNVIEREERFISTINKVNDLLKQNRELMEELSKGQDIKYLKEEINSYEALGYSVGRVLQKKLDLAKAEEKQATIDLSRSGGQNNMTDNYMRQMNIVAHAAERIGSLNLEEKGILNEENYSRGKYPEAYKNRLERIDKLREAAKTYHNEQLKILNDYDQKRQEAFKAEVELQNWKDEQIRKSVLDTSKYEEGIIQDKNSRVLSNERSTLAQRVEALRSNLASERRSADSQLNYTLSKPDAKNADGSYTAESQAAIQDSARDKLKANKNYLDAQERIEEDYRKRKYNASKELEIDIYETQKEYNDARIELVGKDFKQYLSLIQSNAELEKSIENKKYQELLSNQSEVVEQARRGDSTAKKELEKLENDHYRNLSIISSKGELELRRIKETAAQYLIDEKEKLFQGKLRSEGNVSSSNQLNELKEYNDSFESLISELKSGRISVEQFSEAKKNLDEGFKKKDIDIQIEGLTKIRKLLWSNGQSVLQIDTEIENLRKQKAELGLKSVEDIEKKKFQIKKQYQGLEYDLAQEGANLIKTIIDRGYQDQINNLQDAIDANQSAADEEVKNLDNVVMAEQEKAARVTHIKEQAQARENELVREQKRIRYEQAKFEQLSSLASIAIKTLETVAKIELEAAALAAIPVVGPGLAALALTQVPIAIGIGVLQAGAILAKGLPKFKDGGFAPGGPIIANEDGEELFVRPGGEMYWGGSNKASIMNPEKDTQIIPHHQADAYLLNRMAKGLNDVPEALDNRVPNAIDKSAKTIVKAIKENRPVIKNELKVDLSRAVLENYLRS